MNLQLRYLRFQYHPLVQKLSVLLHLQLRYHRFVRHLKIWRLLIIELIYLVNHHYYQELLLRSFPRFCIRFLVQRMEFASNLILNQRKPDSSAQFFENLQRLYILIVPQTHLYSQVASSPSLHYATQTLQEKPAQDSCQHYQNQFCLQQMKLNPNSRTKMLAFTSIAALAALSSLNSTKP